MRYVDCSPHVDDPDLVDRMRLVEGDRFGRDGDLRDANSRWMSARESYARWKERWEAEEDRVYREEMLSPKAATMIVISGTGGWNRWFVRGDGSVVFSKGHGQPEAIEKAREAGFRVE